MRCARAVALPKTKEVQLWDPLKFRLLMMTSAVYRLCARARLGDLKEGERGGPTPACMRAWRAGVLMTPGTALLLAAKRA
eukprot:2923276-Alexandrium_andersonii.AAC.1